MVANEFFGDSDVRLGYFFFIDRYRLFAPVGFLQEFAFERAGERYFPFRSAANGADITVDSRTMPARAPFAA
jgi:hypothetical protein